MIALLSALTVPLSPTEYVALTSTLTNTLPATQPIALHIAWPNALTLVVTDNLPTT